MKGYKKRGLCASCDSNNLMEILKYPEMPLAGYFHLKKENCSIDKYPLSLIRCRKCNLIQVDGIIDPDILFKDYRYLSSIGLKGHFQKYAQYLIENNYINKQSNIIEIGSNDGVLLEELDKLGYFAVGVEPSDNISEIAKQKGLRVVHDYFNEETAKKYFREGDTDLITASNCLAHIEDIHSVIRGIEYCLSESGTLIFEVHYGKKIFEEMQFDNVYHEHMYYYTISSIEELFGKYGLHITHCEEMSIHSGSIRLVLKKNSVTSPVALEFIEKETQLGLKSDEYYSNFSNDVENYKIQTLNLLKKLKYDGNNIAGYGASGRANVLCNFLGIDNTLIDYIIDESPERIGRSINGIDIVSPIDIRPETNIILIFAWNYSKMIMKKLEDKKYLSFLIPLPTIKIVNNINQLTINSL